MRKGFITECAHQSRICAFSAMPPARCEDASAKSALLRSRVGFIFSLDTILALFLGVIMLTTIFLFLSRQSTPDFGGQDLHHHALALLEAANANESLRMATNGNFSWTLQQFMDNATALSLCANLSIYSSQLQLEQHYSKANCTYARTVGVARRPIYYAGQAKLAVMEVWFR